jgi:hypothetical protein
MDVAGTKGDFGRINSTDQLEPTTTIPNTRIIRPTTPFYLGPKCVVYSVYSVQKVESGQVRDSQLAWEPTAFIPHEASLEIRPYFLNWINCV